MKEYKLRAHIHTVDGSIKPSLKSFNNSRIALKQSIGFELVKIVGGDAWRYFYAGKEVKVTDIIWNKEEGVLTYLFRD